MDEKDIKYFIYLFFTSNDRWSFYREFTKIIGFTGQTTLGYIHVHLIVLGSILFLIIALFCRDTELLYNKTFKKFMVIYNIGLPLMVCMMLIRGIIQALQVQLTSSINGMISGIAGVSHILLMIALWMLFTSLKKVLVNEEK